MANRISGVYAIRNTTTGRVYVGASQDIERRFSDHRGALVRGWPLNRPMTTDRNQYGPESFSFEILEIVIALSDLGRAEIRWQKHFQHEGILYNVYEGRDAYHHRRWEVDRSKSS